MYRTRASLTLFLLPMLGACVGTMDDNGSTKARTVPDEVVALADPSQNVLTARLMPEDGCFWYEYVGPVETTLLPLRTPQGNPICGQSSEVAQAGA
ncbi:hypothetical protein K3551_18715 (plasmid) [Jannaschia sp. M317]|nr:hypothetical protein K3551_18715 [Jannaschia sp. M317]